MITSPAIGFVVYIHKRPDGTPFYIGKGRQRRAFDFAPSRRTTHHKNIVAKYGRENIHIYVIDCESEDHAFSLETAMIACYRKESVALVNLTDGGEGVSGREVSERQQAALTKGRGRQAFKEMSLTSKENILAGLALGRKGVAQWKTTPEGKAHIERLAAIGKKTLHQERSVICAQCKKNFISRSAKAKCCSRKCEQQHRRARAKEMVQVGGKG